MALCVAIFDKEDTVLFLKVKEKGMNSDLSMQVQRFLHNSYDIILDKINYPPAKTNQDLYLGTLLLSTSFRSHGYLTNTSAKFMLVTDAENSMLKDHEIRLFFKKLHTKYCNAISNPFYELGSSVKSRIKQRQMTARVVRIKNVSDFIEPSQRCILPIHNQPIKEEKKLVNIHSKSTALKRPVKLTLDDCIVCSGCVTTADSLIEIEDGPVRPKKNIVKLAQKKSGQVNQTQKPPTSSQLDNW